MRKILIILALGLSLYAEVNKAVSFELKTLDATKSYKMSDFKGDVILLNLWASWCSSCKKEMPEFFQLQNRYKTGFKIVTVSIDKNSKNSIDFLKSVESDTGMKTPFISLYDPEKSLAKAYRAKGMPSSYLIDKDGVIQDVMVGSLSHDDIMQLSKKIDKLILK